MKAVTTQRFPFEERTRTNFLSLQLMVATAKSRFAPPGKRDSGRPREPQPSRHRRARSRGRREQPRSLPRDPQPATCTSQPMAEPRGARCPHSAASAPCRSRPCGSARRVPSAPSPAVGALSGAAASPAAGPPPPRPGRSPHLPTTPPPPAGRGNMKRSRLRAARRRVGTRQRRCGHPRALSGGGRAGALPGRRRAGREPWGAAAAAVPEGARVPRPASRLPPSAGPWAARGGAEARAARREWRRPERRSGRGAPRTAEMSAPYGSLVRYLFSALLLHGECAAGGARPAGCPQSGWGARGARSRSGGAEGRGWVRSPVVPAGAGSLLPVAEDGKRAAPAGSAWPPC